MLEFWQHYLNPFLNSSFFVALTTVLVAYAAYWLYMRQKDDERQKAAQIIVFEVRNAEKQLKDAHEIFTQYRVLRDSNADVSSQRMFPEKLQVMKTDNWGKYRYLFSSDILPALLNEIDEFYLNCHLFDEAIAYIDSAFSKNEAEVRSNAFRIVANYQNEALHNLKDNPSNDPKIATENSKLMDNYKERLDAFKNTFPTAYIYSPVKPYQDAEYFASLLFATKLTAARLEKSLTKNKMRRKLNLKQFK